MFFILLCVGHGFSGPPMLIPNISPLETLPIDTERSDNINIQESKPYERTTISSWVIYHPPLEGCNDND